MASYNSFLFEGHGKSEKTGAFDPGATKDSITEYGLNKSIVDSAFKYLSTTKLNIHRDNNNFTDQDLQGNTYSSNCGLVVHINSGGGTGSEIYVPCKEKYLKSDFELVDGIAKLLGIPNRGVKSRDYNSGVTYLRTNGLALNYTDYYAEIRDGWNRGISLSLVEIGFIDTSDLSKMQSNIDNIGYLCAKWVADNCDTPLKPISTPPVNPKISYVVQVGAFSDKANAEKLVAELKAKGYDAIIKEI